MFRGINLIALDAKGRMALPSRYRESPQADQRRQWVLTIDPESPCLLLYPLPEWEVIEEKLQALPSFNPTARRIQRLLIGHATELELDANGRMLLPPLLRAYAKLDKQLILVGQGKKFEIWDEHQWNEQRNSWLLTETQVSNLPETLQSLAL